MAQLSMFMVSKIFPSRKRKIVVDGIVPRGWGGPGRGGGVLSFELSGWMARKESVLRIVDAKLK